MDGAPARPAFVFPEAFNGRRNYGNWELSVDRPNSARRLMQQSGLGEKQIAQVRGFADQLLRKPENPLDPSNRRISLIVIGTEVALRI